MVNYREILRLSALKHVQRDVCSAMHCSDHTVRAVLKEAAKHNIHWPLDEDIINAELERILFPDKYQKISTYVEPDYPYIHRELARPGVIAAQREDDIVAAGIDMIHRLPEQLVDMIRMFDQFMHKIPPPNKKHKRRFAKLQNAFVSGFSIACILSCEIAAVKVMLGRGVCACAEKFYRPCGR